MSSFSERAARGIARVEASDADALRTFQLGAFGIDSRQVDVDFTSWLFGRNPGASPDQLAHWVCRRDDKIVGQQGELAVALKIGSSESLEAWAVDLMVDPTWRLRGVGPALTAAQRASRGVVCGVELSDAAHRQFVRTGWIDLGEVPLYAMMLATRGIPRDSARSALALLAARAVAAVAVGVRSAVGRTRGIAGDLVRVDTFDPRADEIWAASSPSYPVIARRDMQWLRWRFDDGPQRTRYFRYYMLRRDGTALGYVVVRPGTWRGTPVLSVVDYLAPPALVPALFARAARLARRGGAQALFTLTLNSRAERGLRTTGFIRSRRGVDDGTRFMVSVTEPGPARDLVGNPSNWFVTAADSDIDHPTEGNSLP